MVLFNVLHNSNIRNSSLYPVQKKIIRNGEEASYNKTEWEKPTIVDDAKTGISWVNNKKHKKP